MAGGVMQLIAQGDQNGYLTGDNPDVTFWRTMHSTHTNFALESAELTFSGQMGFGRKFHCVIPRNGDLVSDMFLCFTVPGIVADDKLDDAGAVGISDKDLYANQFKQGFTGIPPFATNLSGSVVPAADGTAEISNVEGPHPDGVLSADNYISDAYGALAAGLRYATWTDSLGHALIQEVSISVGGSVIDTHTGEWLQLWEEFAGGAGKRMREMIGKFDTLPQLVNFWNAESRKLYVPLRWWFCGNPGLALPMIGLQFHDVRVDVQTKTHDKLIITSKPDTQAANLENYYHKVATPSSHGGITSGDLNCTLFCEYVYLEGDERRSFANLTHEYLIHQVQRQTEIPIMCNSSSHQAIKVQQKLDMNHPVCTLLFTVQQMHVAEANRVFNYAGDNGEDPVTAVRLTLNGQDRFSAREGRWFRLVEPFKTAENIPSMYAYMIPFGLKPLDPVQPTGSLNMSKIENAMLHLTMQVGLRDSTLNIYGYGWNVFRVTAGMGGNAYAS